MSESFFQGKRAYVALRLNYAHPCYALTNLCFYASLAARTEFIYPKGSHFYHALIETTRSLFLLENINSLLAVYGCRCMFKGLKRLCTELWFSSLTE